MSKKVALMCGHGKSADGHWDSGCAYAGYTEAGLMLPITRVAVKYLRDNGITVISDADTDNNKNMIVDVAWANREKADIYVSIHCDYSKAPSGVYPLYVSAEGKKLAEALNGAIKLGMPMRSRGTAKRTDLWELNGTDMPACILETGAIKADLDILKTFDKYGKCVAKGIMAYLGVQEKKKATKTMKYTGQLPTYKIVKTNAQVIADTIAWLKYIASNSNFHYGYGRHAHHNGCYFCGSQPSSKKNAGIKMWKTTYCCNPFIHAGWAHGGCIPRAMAMCRQGNSWDYSASGSGTYATCDLFTKLGKPKKSALKAGDVLCNDYHVAMYIGNGQYIDAGHEDDNVIRSSKWNSSIAVRTLTDKAYNMFTRVYRYNSSVNAGMSIFHGEMSDRVKNLTAFLNWYYDGKAGTVQRYYGDNAMAYVKRFQRENKLTANGIVDQKTIDAMAKAVKVVAK